MSLPFLGIPARLQVGVAEKTHTVERPLRLPTQVAGAPPPGRMTLVLVVEGQHVLFAAVIVPVVALREGVLN